MAFPTIAAANQGNETVNALSHTVNLPTGIASGNLLIAAVAMDGNTTLSWPAGWSSLAGPTNSPSDGTLEVRYRIASGGEGSSIIVTTTGSEQCSYVTWRVTNWHGITPPEAGTPALLYGEPPPPHVVITVPASERHIVVEEQARVVRVPRSNRLIEVE